MRFLILTVTLTMGLAATRVHATNACVVMVPQDCEIVNTNYSASSTDGTHVIQVDCRKLGGELVKYLTTRFALSSIFGMGRDYLPRKITFAPWPRDAIRINCH